MNRLNSEYARGYQTAFAAKQLASKTARKARLLAARESINDLMNQYIM